MPGESADAHREVVVAAGLTGPDGRALHVYSISPAQQAELQRVLCWRLAPGRNHVPMPAAFVLWAAEYIRSSFPGGQLTWAFVFQGLGLPENRDLAVRLVKDGLRWWRRGVRVSEAGQRMFLYSLMAEGGLPQALLAQEGLYRRVVLGLLEEIEAEGGADAERIAERIADRWVAALPQTFRTADFARLLAEFGLALARLRARVPEDLSGQAAEHWLNQIHPGWDAELPLRMSPAIAEQLIRPALGSERRRAASAGPLATRELCRDDSGCWRWFVRLRDEGFLPGLQLPDAVGLQLRLLPTGAAAVTAEAVVWAATPDQGGWQIRRIGRTGDSLLPLAPDVPFVLGAFADGRPLGEVVVTAGLPDASEAPTLWRAADIAAGADAVRLVVQPGSGRARAACLWILGPENVPASAHGCVAVAGPEPVTGGFLWRVSGQGTLSLGPQHRFRIETNAAEEATESRLVPVGRVLSVWRTERERGLVYCGRPQILGEMGAAGLHLLPDRALRFVQTKGRALAEQMVEWVEKGEVLARLRLTSLPQETRLSITEEAAGRVRLAAAGLPQGLRVDLRAGTAEARADLADGRGEIVLDVTGAPPGQIALRLTDIDSGAGLHLIAPWPARAGLILDPDGNRLERDTPIAADALRGWRAVVPEGATGELAMRLVRHPVVAVSAAGEVPLHSYLPLIRAMLAQGGPDAQINLNLIVQGREGNRLEVRRYQDQALVEGDELRTGLARGTRTAPQTALAAQLDKRPVTLHAVDLTLPGKPVVIEAATTRKLRTLLGDSGGTWLIQSRLENRVQRAVAWAPRPTPHSIRSDRIAQYADRWRQLLEAPEEEAWEHSWRLITSLAQGGDAGVADQVQALANASAAVVALALRVPQAALAEALALDVVAPFFWPAVPVTSFVAAIQTDHRRRQQLLVRAGFEPDEAEEEANNSLARRIEAILVSRPELAGHFGAALVEAHLVNIAVVLNGCASIPSLFIANPVQRLRELGQDAARRFDRLPSGISGIVPTHRLPGMMFNRYAQPMIDAPVVAAEFAADRRPPASVRELLALINLRLVDHLYFDAALPAAVALVLKENAE